MIIEIECVIMYLRYLIGGCIDRDQCNVNIMQLYRAKTAEWEYSMLSNSTVIYGIGQTFTTLNEVIYFNINGNIGSYDMRNEIYNYPFKSLLLRDINEACTTSDSDKLYFIGGINTGDNNIESNEFQIYNILNDSWNVNTPRINIPRYYSTCNTLQDTIYIIGGATTTIALDTIECINTDLLDKWEVLSSKLTIKRAKHRSIVYDNLIVIIAGEDINGNALKDITMFDTITGNVFENGMKPLNIERIGANAMYDGNRIFVFGGLNSNGIAQNNWEFTYDLWTQSPSSAAPSKLPSHNPTIIPTDIPTSSPSTSPTKYPSKKPLMKMNLGPNTKHKHHIIVILLLLAITSFTIIIIIIMYCYHCGKRIMKFQSKNDIYISMTSSPNKSPSTILPSLPISTNNTDLTSNKDSQNCISNQIEGDIKTKLKSWMSDDISKSSQLDSIYDTCPDGQKTTTKVNNTTTMDYQKN